MTEAVIKHKPRPAGEILTFGINNEDINFTASAKKASAMRNTIETPPASVIAAQRAAEIVTHSDFVLMEETFLCQHPVHPVAWSETIRLKTFFDRADIWKFTSPQEMAEAGFFSTGKRDKVKCWYCNGILQGWEAEDNGWEEHAKWFPLCEFLLQQKGVRFVYEIVKKFPDLKRPTLSNPASVNLIQNIIKPGISMKSSPRSKVYASIESPEQMQKRTSELVLDLRNNDDDREIRIVLFGDHRMHDEGYCSDCVYCILYGKKDSK